ncbi:MAG: hypothetical protein HYW01_05450 [Deltaproteobacteria bacterium]|nr:hypothetical protein [Deltaproteobacteria bacterium]
MKTFEFLAFNPLGKKELGTVKAWRLSEAKKKIQQMGFYLASIKIQNDSVGSGVAIQRDGSQGASSYVKKSFSFFKELKEFFFSREKSGNS